MKRWTLAILLTFSLNCMAKWPIPDSPLPNDQKISSSTSLNQIADRFWQEVLKSSPTWATFLGDRRFDAQLADISEEAIAAEYAFYASLLMDLQQIDRKQLKNHEDLTADVLEHELTSRVEGAQCKTWLWVVDQLDGPQITFAELTNFHSISSHEDARNLLTRYRKISGYYTQHMANLRRGMAQNYISPRINVEQVIKQLEWQLKQSPEKSPYFATVRLPDNWDEQQKNDIKRDLLASVSANIYPALSSYRDFLKNELLKKTRNNPGIGAIPQGAQCYQALIRQHTGLAKSPDEIHQLGLSEVRRIKSDMAKLVSHEKNHPSLATYMKQLRREKNQFVNSREELLAYNQRLVSKAQNALPRAFDRLPQTAIEVKSIEPFREREAPAAFYYEAPKDGTRPAFYYLNTYQPHERALYNMAVLAFHEALPGHHLQIALANENKLLPEFQRQIGQTAFVEGWALYAESLAGELGLYESIAEKLGALNYELWRALRLVVDTGLHHKSWSRQKAIRYLAEQTALSQTEVVNEIDRYIVWPGQALAYKIGQLEIAAARKEAEQKLGVRFSLTAFHDRLLAFGALPLASMRRNIDNWVKEQEISGTNKGFVLMP